MLAGQALLNYIGSHLSVSFQVIDNLDPIRKSSITLKNDGDEDIPKDKWRIYLSHLCVIASEIPEVDIFHLNGGLFKLELTEEFNGLKTGEKIVIPLTSEEPVVSKYSLFPKWYVAGDDLDPVVIKSTDDEDLSFVGNFDSPEKWKKGKTDASNPFTPEERFERYGVKDAGYSPKLVIPTPLQTELKEDKFVDLTLGDWSVFCDVAEFVDEVKMLSDYLKISKSKGEKAPTSHCINIVKTEVANSSDEAYEMNVDDASPSIKISASSACGLFYAAQTIISFIESSEDKKMIPAGHIKDAPRFPYRGLHMDVSRNFASADEVIKFIKVMSSYKMNRFHFHLTDDEGWRLEIPDLPELTQVGAIRDHVLSLKGLAVEPTLGSGPGSNSSGSGFYTVSDYRRILSVAKQHHVEVIPEIDMPGHSYAAVVAMTARYHKFKSKGEMSSAEEYMLINLSDRPVYTSDQMYTGNTMNPCLEGTRRFVEKIITTLKELHEPIQPLKTFHVGGDEVPIGAWDSSTLCQEYYAKHHNQKDNSEDDEIDKEELKDLLEKRRMTNCLQEYFMESVKELCKKHELQLAVWNDGIHDPTKEQTCDHPMLVNAWRISQKSNRHNPYVLANSGYKVVLSPATHTYFDHPYEPHPHETGLTWCVRKLEDMTIFGMKPFDMYSCQEKTLKFKHEKLTKKSSIIGIQAQIWRELIRTDQKLEYMIFPRLLALAERAWHEASWENESKDCKAQQEDWAEFTNTMGHKELRRLEKWGVNFRLPPPGVRVDDSKFEVNSVYPGMKFKFRKCGTEEWKVWKNQGTDDYEKGKEYEFVTSSFDGQRSSRSVTSSL